MSENKDDIVTLRITPKSETVANPTERNTISDGSETDKITSKTLETRASISSVDSSISLSYDAAPFTPRSSFAAAGSSTDDDESKVTTTKPSLAAAVATANARTIYCGRYSDAVNATDSSSGNESSTAVKEGTANAPPGANDEHEPFEPPDDELTKRIVDQVEYYFSDENIVKDAFLLKHVRRNKEGYVSLKLIASFKRVKHIARDWRVVRAALEKSAKLEINEAGTKLRRRDPLPLYDQTTPSRTVVAVHLPPERATIESVAEMFRECGEIALIRVLRPGNPVPADVRPFYNKHPEMHDSTSALIEFVRTESAHNALNREPSEGDPVRVLELNAPASKKKVPMKKAYRNGAVSTMAAAVYDDFSSSCLSSSEAEDRYRLRSLPHHAPKTSPAATPALDQQQPHWPAAATSQQRRWSRESGSDSSVSSFTARSRSNSNGVYFVPDQRRLSAGWESSCSESYGSCRSRSSSGVSIPDAFQMRRYSVPRKDTPSYCCCNYNGKCGAEMAAGRRYSVGKDEYGCFGSRTLSRCGSSNDSSDCGGGCGSYRKESFSEFYQQQPSHQHRNSVTGGAPFERRPSLTRPCNGEGNWSRSNSCSGSSNDGRRLSDPDGQQRFGGGLTQRRGSFGNVGMAADTVVRLPRGPDGGRGFQRELIEYALPE